MNLLKKIVMKLITLVIMVAIMGALMRYARPYLMKSAGLPQGMPSSGVGVESVHFSSEESDLMGTIFKSAIRLLTGSATRKELAGEVSNKLYAGRANASEMSELGIELVQQGGPAPAASTGGAAKPGQPSSSPAASPAGSDGNVAKSQIGAAARLKPGETIASRFANNPHDAVLTQLWRKALANPELALVPVVLGGMAGVGGLRRRRRSPEDDFILPDMSSLLPSDSEPYDMTHPVHSLKAEDFELLVALVYQRQGYRVSMPAGLSGGRGGDFMLLRKAERLLVQCKKHAQDFKVPIDRVRELHEAIGAAGATGGLYVASCGFSWDARNFAKGKGVTVINARTLDQLITAAKEKPDENLLAVAQWAPKFMTKVKLTPPLCPTCEANMDQLAVSAGSVWVCSQRPDCRGRRSSRSYQKAESTARAAIVA